MKIHWIRVNTVPLFVFSVAVLLDIQRIFTDFQNSLIQILSVKNSHKYPTFNSSGTEKMTLLPQQKSFISIASANQNCCGDDFTCYADNFN